MIELKDPLALDNELLILPLSAGDNDAATLLETKDANPEQELGSQSNHPR